MRWSFSVSYASSAGPRTSPLWRTIQREILDPLSIDILEGKVREGQTVHVNAKGGGLSMRRSA
jgi:ATP-dependent Clp protease ATP-binding subunit ClpA